MSLNQAYVCLLGAALRRTELPAVVALCFGSLHERLHFMTSRFRMCAGHAGRQVCCRRPSSARNRYPGCKPHPGQLRGSGGRHQGEKLGQHGQLSSHGTPCLSWDGNMRPCRAGVLSLAGLRLCLRRCCPVRMSRTSSTGATSSHSKWPPLMASSSTILVLTLLCGRWMAALHGLPSMHLSAFALPAR